MTALRPAPRPLAEESRAHWPALALELAGLPAEERLALESRARVDLDRDHAAVAAAHLVRRLDRMSREADPAPSAGEDDRERTPPPGPARQPRPPAPSALDPVVLEAALTARIDVALEVAHPEIRARVLNPSHVA